MRLTTRQDQRAETQKGTIKWFSQGKGYGFIDGNDGVRRFFHVADTVDDFSPKTGNFILFEPRQDRKGPRAVGVRLNPDSLVEVNRPFARNGRMSCPHCGTSIVPRVVFNYGAPIYSVCQFCGGKVVDFREDSVPWLEKIFSPWVTLILIGLAIMLASVGGRQASPLIGAIAFAVVAHLIYWSVEAIKRTYTLLVSAAAGLTKLALRWRK
jgi:cold shock CspA family protein